MKGGMAHQNIRVEGWYTDRAEIFDRLRHVETLCEVASAKGGNGA